MEAECQPLGDGGFPVIFGVSHILFCKLRRCTLFKVLLYPYTPPNINKEWYGVKVILHVWPLLSLGI